MLERFVLKNAADCTSQRLKRSFAARVMTFLSKLYFFVVFEPREYARSISSEKCCRLHYSTCQTALWGPSYEFVVFNYYWKLLIVFVFERYELIVVVVVGC